MWVYAHYGKAQKCENQGCVYPRKNSKGRLLVNPKYNWANVSGEYKRDISDWIQLCASCHQRWDRGYIKVKNIKK